MADVETVRQQVQKTLVDWLGHIEIDRAGDFTFPHESTRVFIRVVPFNEMAVVNVYAYTAVEVPPSPELYQHVATNADGFIFGHMSAMEHEGKVAVLFSHRLLGDHLQPDELQTAVRAVAATANQVDDELAQQFGGHVFNQPAVLQPTPAGTEPPRPDGPPRGPPTTTPEGGYL